MKSHYYISSLFVLLQSIMPLSSIAQERCGSNIVTRIYIGSIADSSLVSRVYDNGLGDVIQEVTEPKSAFREGQQWQDTNHKTTIYQTHW